MELLIHLLTSESVAHTIFVLTLIVALGLVLGSLRIFGIQLGMAGVLFAGIIFGHFKISIHPEIAEFAREFGLILFVYTIGIQVGPAFFASLKREGLGLNAMAASVVLMGAGITFLLIKLGGIPYPVAVGMFSGATTNTPSLAAAQQALKEIPSVTADMIKMPGLGYAVCYPFGIFGIILTMIAVRTFFKIKPQAEAEAYSASHAKGKPTLTFMDIHINNANIMDCPIEKILLIENSGVVVSRIMHGGQSQVAFPDSRVSVGDIVRAVGHPEKLKMLQMALGHEVKADWAESGKEIIARPVILSRKEVVGKTVGELDAFIYGVTLTRIIRSEIEIPASPDIELNFADTLIAVGEESAIKKFAAIVGNSTKELNHPHLIPIFVGLALGVIVGSWPISISGIPAPVKLGLAGGPLLVALILSRIGRIGKLIWYMPASANFMLREIGISLFLACVGLRSGDKFVETLVQGDGVVWMLGGAVITVVPIMIVGLIARLRYKMNYLTLCGLLAGSMTDPPALAFANQITPSSAQVVSYAAVYPLVMLLRVLSAQILVLLLSNG